MKPVGEWNHMVITCDGPKHPIELNGEMVTRMDLDQWTAPTSSRRLGAQVRHRLQGPSALRLHRAAGPRFAVLVQEHQDQAAQVVTFPCGTEADIECKRLPQALLFGTANWATNAACSGVA